MARHLVPQPRGGLGKTLLFSSLILLALAIPNLAPLFPGLGGTFATRVAWLALFLFVVVSRLAYRGTGALSMGSALYISVLMLSALYFVGLILGIGYVRSLATPMGLLTQLLLVGPMLLGAESVRSLAMSLPLGKNVRIGVASIAAFLCTEPIRSIYAKVSPVLGGDILSLIVLVPPFFYHVIVSEIAYRGGMYSGLVFRLLTDGFLRIFPFRPDVGALGIASILFLTVIYYTLYMYISLGDTSLVGKSLELFKGTRIRKAVSIGGIVMVFVAAVVVLYMAIANLVPLVVVSTSMKPLIDVGDVIIVKREADVSVGDIAVFWIGGKLVAHRVIEVREDGLRTMGDAIGKPDPWIVKYDYLIGKVVASLPRLGIPTLILRGIAPSEYMRWALYVVLLGIAMTYAIGTYRGRTQKRLF